MTSPDHAALADVRVSLTHDASGTVVDTQTDERGEFAFVGLAPGSWSLSATAAGFGAGRLSLPLEPREVRTATVIMEIRRFEATVQVTADAARLTSTHSPSSTVIDGSRLEALPASLQQNLPEAVVSAAPGMIRGHDDFVHVRGHEVALNPIINGVSFRENPHGVFSAGLSPRSSIP